MSKESLVYLEVSLESQEVSRVFQGCFKGVSRKFKGCFKEVLREFQKSFHGVSRKFKRVSKEFPCCFNYE